MEENKNEFMHTVNDTIEVARLQGSFEALLAVRNSAKKCGGWISTDSLISSLDGLLAECYGRMGAYGEFGKQIAEALKKGMEDEK